MIGEIGFQYLVVPKNPFFGLGVPLAGVLMAKKRPQKGQNVKIRYFSFYYFFVVVCGHSYASIHVLTFCSGPYGTLLIQ